MGYRKISNYLNLKKIKTKNLLGLIQFILILKNIKKTNKIIL